MNYIEILEKLKKENESIEDIAYGDFSEEFGKIEEVDRGGGENKGSHWYRVYHFVDHNVYLQVTGYYQSYDGTDFHAGWGSCSEVTPKKKEIIVYETV
jgi:hypothetical protein